MKSIRNRRLWTPVAMLAWGAVFAAAVAIGHGGVGGAIAAAVFCVAAAVGYYAWGGQDSDYGALIGARADERQALIRTRARALAGTAMAAVAVTGVVVTVALGFGHLPGSYWLCQLLLIVGTVSYNVGLRRYGARGADEDLPEPMYNWWGASGG